MDAHALLYTSIRQHVNITDVECRQFLALGVERKFKKGQFLISEGSVARKTFFVRKGAVIAYYVDLDGVEHVLQFAIEGWWISDIHSFVRAEAARLNLEAIEDCEVYEFSAEAMDKAYTDLPPVTRYFLKITQNAFATFQARVQAALSTTAEERYALFKKLYPKIELRFPQKRIASYIGITPESLSRIKKAQRNLQ